MEVMSNPIEMYSRELVDADLVSERITSRIRIPCSTMRGGGG